MQRDPTPSPRPLRILMLAPEPVFQPRGTPISISQRLQVLSGLGYTIDLVTYPFGEPVSIPWVRVLRVWRPWGLTHIKIGPSAAKILLDLFMAVVAMGCLLRRRYAAIHTHEEAVFIGALYARWFRLPHLYDMHSSLPQQFENWGAWYAPLVTATGRALERWALRHSTVVITICQALTDHVRTVTPQTVQVLIENLPDTLPPMTDHDREAARRHHNLDGAPVVVYAGNFEPYQGIDLLLSSFVQVHRAMPQARLLLVGGESSAIQRHQNWAIHHGLAEAVVFTGQLTPELAASYLAAADVLVSPRISGTNTPLKVGAYLKAGKALVATDLPTHTQLLTPDVALLAKAEPDAFAQALLLALTGQELRMELGRRAQAFADERFSTATYRHRVAQAYQLLLRDSGNLD